MPETPKDLYAASCNPPRRAKRTNLAVSSPKSNPPAIDGQAQPTLPHSQLRAILPMKPYTPRENATTAELEPPPPPAKRGRKPGPLSRSAREAQRRLNHSIIEKARRTKINDALATLKQLVPANYGQPSKLSVASDDEDEEDDDYEDDSGKSKSKPKPKIKAPGKKEEKEKEFKLEILVRTVTFLQDLLGRVAALEAAALTNAPDSVPDSAALSPGSVLTPLSSHRPTCPNCSADAGSTAHLKKRKRLHIEQEDLNDISYHDNHQHSGRTCDPDKSPRLAKFPRRSSPDLEPAPTNRAPPQARNFGEPADNVGLTTDPAVPVAPVKPSLEYRPRHRSHAQVQRESSERLPSISSWLPDEHASHAGNAMIDPQFFPPPANPRARSHSSSASPVGPVPSSMLKSYLPSPPSSTHFDPVRASAIPPLLNLGPVATAAMVGTSGTSNASSSSSSASIERNEARARSMSKSINAPSVRTPEDESAASLLLQISTSPTFRPVSSSSSTSDPAASDPSRFWLHSASDVRSQPVGASLSGAGSGLRSRSRHMGRGEDGDSRKHSRTQAQTPSSLLGLSSVLHGR